MGYPRRVSGYLPSNINISGNITTGGDGSIGDDLDVVGDLTAGTISSDSSLTWAGQTVMGGVISPTALSGDVTDYDPSGLSGASVVRIDPGGAGRTINSLAGGVDNRVITLINLGSTVGHVLTLLMDNGGTGTAAMRFWCPNGVNFIMAIRASVMLRYDATSARWRVIGPIA
jgi:hypothetical protein